MDTLTLSDGRTLTYDVYGDPGGTPVIFNHGLSDSRLIRNPDDALPRRSVCAWSSQTNRVWVDPRPRRTARWSTGARTWSSSPTRSASSGSTWQVTQAAGLTRWSIAVRMPDRVGRVVLASPVAPLDEPGMAKLMINKDLKLIAKLHHLHHLIKWGSDLSAKKALKDMPSFVEATAKDDASDADTFLKDPAQRADVRGIVHRGHGAGR